MLPPQLALKYSGTLTPWQLSWLAWLSIISTVTMPVVFDCPAVKSPNRAVSVQAVPTGAALTEKSDALQAGLVPSVCDVQAVPSFLATETTTFVRYWLPDPPLVTV